MSPNIWLDCKQASRTAQIADVRCATFLHVGFQLPGGTPFLSLHAPLWGYTKNTADLMKLKGNK